MVQNEQTNEIKCHTTHCPHAIYKYALNYNKPHDMHTPKATQKALISRLTNHLTQAFKQPTFYSQKQLMFAKPQSFYAH